MNCIVCGSMTSNGLAPWHTTCRYCDYESADLAAGINERNTHAGLDEGDRETALRALRVENFEAILDETIHFAPAGANAILDVGCAHGWFLEAARGQFKHVLGIEPDAALSEQAMAKGLPVRAGFFPGVLEEGEAFDVIVFNDVIEHITDIHAALAACRERLTPDGLLILNLPSSRGFFYRLASVLARLGVRGPFERLWQKGLPSPHVHYFNHRNLSRLVSSSGFFPVHFFELPALRMRGLMERLRFTGQSNRAILWAQYVSIVCAIPVLSMFPSDAVVCMFRKR
ncbi:class I SAM-dependent methyltransferase [Massilia soli]|uniref:Class I SAM-dependent methyltransferase n=1 Tax=Massilia soli TaxID=2792854 RepID=A0ABS7SNM1_9BURK|nr:class I SAM-dependent methyltransferase [Massilia soli]MBZ2206745.1 class I SAM-dependent methyltransferase [Massilia soli]